MIEHADFLLRVGVAALAGLIVGLDREVKKKPLGARAYMLTSAASAAWFIITINLSIDLAARSDELNLDPTRLVQGLVGAIGFLGAGAIITTTDEGRLRGVASGAAIWGVGAIGLAAGAGYHFEALVLAVLIAIVLNVYDLVKREE